VKDEVAALAFAFRSAQRAVVLTGAGISVPSGLRPYRGPGGLWTEHPERAAELVAGISVERMWALLGPDRTNVMRAEPNAAHHALVTLERAAVARGASFTIVTQNIDALHTRAGSASVIELHGRLCRSRCTACEQVIADEVPHVQPPHCARCDAPLRPDVVLFDEVIGAAEDVAVKRAFRGVDLFVAVGTSGTVWPAASFVRWAEFERARTVLVDLAPKDDPGWNAVITGRAEEILPRLSA
jgi:NAD-dependent deacetylase